MRVEESRTVRLAARVTRGEENELAMRLKEGSTHISIDPSVAGAADCAEVLVSTQLRGPGRVSVDPRGFTAGEMAALTSMQEALRPSEPLQVTSLPASSATHIAVARNGGNISVVPDGHGARLARGRPLAQRRAPSALGIVFAASLAAGEAFKEAAQISPEYAQRPVEMAFCPVTLGGVLDVAPSLPTDWKPLLTLAGVGAINTAASMILGRLTASGNCLSIDRERYDRENVGTYSLGTTHDVSSGAAKVDLPPMALHGWRHCRHEGDIASAILEVDRGTLPWTPVVLAGLDNHEARADAQRLQADRLLDAATSDSVVGLRDAKPEGPCLLCMLVPRARPAPTDALVKLGIPYELALAPGKAVVDESIIASAADDAARELLRSQRGTPICGLLRAAGLTDLEADDFMPAVPFISQQAACLSVGRLIAIATGIDRDLPNFFQYDALIGPHAAVRQHRIPNPHCVCQQRAATVDAIRKERRSRRFWEATVTRDITGNGKCSGYCA
jgi:hypothetical protein